jgi:hypothetical protein
MKQTNFEYFETLRANWQFQKGCLGKDFQERLKQGPMLDLVYKGSQ